MQHEEIRKLISWLESVVNFDREEQTPGYKLWALLVDLREHNDTCPANPRCFDCRLLLTLAIALEDEDEDERDPRDSSIDITRLREVIA